MLILKSIDSIICECDHISDPILQWSKVWKDSESSWTYSVWFGLSFHVTRLWQPPLLRVGGQTVFSYTSATHHTWELSGRGWRWQMLSVNPSVRPWTTVEPRQAPHCLHLVSGKIMTMFVRFCLSKELSGNANYGVWDIKCIVRLGNKLTVWRIFTFRGKIVSQDPLPNEKG